MKTNLKAREYFLENFCNYLLPGSLERKVPSFTKLGLLNELLTLCEPSLILSLEFAYSEIVQSTYARNELTTDELHDTFDLLVARWYRQSMPVISEMLSLYYSNKVVIESMDLNPSLPFPKGIRLDEINYDLLVPVVAQGRKYRIVRGDDHEVQ